MGAAGYKKRTAISFPCPTCGARPGRDCEKQTAAAASTLGGGWGRNLCARPHAARYAARREWIAEREALAQHDAVRKAANPLAYGESIPCVNCKEGKLVRRKHGVRCACGLVVACKWIRPSRLDAAAKPEIATRNLVWYCGDEGPCDGNHDADGFCVVCGLAKPEAPEAEEPEPEFAVGTEVEIGVLGTAEYDRGVVVAVNEDGTRRVSWERAECWHNEDPADLRVRVFGAVTS